MGDLLRIHEWAYITKIKEVCKKSEESPLQLGFLDGDTAVSPKTFDAALAAAGAVCRAVDAIMDGKVGSSTLSPSRPSITFHVWSVLRLGPFP
jgi:acetoin utilization deacetylase AcuC-like enzyme